jgi:hypothetical protein
VVVFLRPYAYLRYLQITGALGSTPAPLSRWPDRGARFELWEATRIGTAEGGEVHLAVRSVSPAFTRPYTCSDVNVGKAFEALRES